VRLSPETCRVKPLRRIKTQLLHLVGLISLLYSRRYVWRCVNTVLSWIRKPNWEVLHQLVWTDRMFFYAVSFRWRTHMNTP